MMRSQPNYSSFVVCLFIIVVMRMNVEFVFDRGGL